MNCKSPSAVAASLRDRFIGKPVMIDKRDLAKIVGRVVALETGAFGFDFDSGPSRDKDYDVVAGIAVVPVQGVLVHEQSLWGYWFGGETSYKQLASTLVDAMADSAVRAVALHVNSPGGEVAGCFDLVDGIYGLRGTKPIWSIVDEQACSAAYAIASAADRIVVPRTGETGSIGVVTQHIDITGALDKAGVKVTTIQFGARKTDSYPTTALSAEAQARLQADVDAMGELFVSTVARNRKLSATKVRSTEAATFLGAGGVEQGLVDAVMAPDAAFLSLLESLN
jgi:signal peptide peptidase SppA